MADEPTPSKSDGSFNWPMAVTAMFVVLCVLVCALGRMNALPWK